MLRRHGSERSDSRASDSDADYRLATGPRWLQGIVKEAISASPISRVQLGPISWGGIAIRRGSIAAFSGLLIMASLFLPLPKDQPAYARELTADSMQPATTDNSQSWQVSPSLSSQIGSLFNIGPAASGQQQNSSTDQSSGSAQQSQPASQPAPRPAAAPSTAVPDRVTPSSRGGSRPTPDISTPDKFIAAVADAAQASQADSGVPPAVTIAQAILESDWGRSLLSTKAQNYFGIKATKGPGPAGAINMNTWEVLGGANVTVTDAFKAYHNLYESVMDHGRFLADNARYAAAFKVPNDPDEFARRIAAAGYATDPAYPTKLINLMTKYNLYQYDLPQPGN